jgi:broad specificity phosphatase PhoE
MDARFDIPVDSFLYLRHGRTTDNEDHIISGGERDVALTEEGRKKAASLAEIFSRLTDIKEICCSPMKRAIETAQPLNLLAQKPIRIVSTLHEWLVGDYAGRDEKTYGIQLTDWSFDPPGGETRIQLQDRVHEAALECFSGSASEKKLIVGHAGFWRGLAKNLGMPLVEIDNCTFYEVYRKGNTWHYNKATFT